MDRTEQRPIAQGRVKDKHALLFSAVMGSLGIFLLVYFINSLTAWLTLGSLIDML